MPNRKMPSRSLATAITVATVARRWDAEGGGARRFHAVASVATGEVHALASVATGEDHALASVSTGIASVATGELPRC